MRFLFGLNFCLWVDTDVSIMNARWSNSSINFGQHVRR